MLRFETLTIDCDDHLAVARFWEAALGWTIGETDDEGTVLRPPIGVADLKPFPVGGGHCSRTRRRNACPATGVLPAGRGGVGTESDCEGEGRIV